MFTTSSTCMHHRLARAATAAALALSLTAAVLAAGPAREAFTTYDELLGHLDRWSGLGASVTVAATSGEGRDIPLVSVGSGPVHVMVTAQLHANEPSGTEAVVQLVDLLLGEPGRALAPGRLAQLTREAPLMAAALDPALRADLLERLTVDVFPMADPDGVENDHTRDFQANTDYATRVTPQGEAIVSGIRTTWPSLFVDLHGGPNEPLNIGIVEPRGTDEVVSRLSRHAAAVTWRTASALDVPVKFFEEHPFELTGLQGDPFDSIDEAYYASLSRLAPVTWESVQLEGIPAVYTETVGLQSTAPEITIHEGASIQLATLLGLLFDQAGLFDGTRPADRLVVESPTEALAEVTVDRPIARMQAVLSWPWDDPLGPITDWGLVVVDAATDEVVAEVASEPGSGEVNRRSRALVVEDLPAGSYRVVATSSTPASPLGDGVLRVWWSHPDPRSRNLARVLGPEDEVALCLDGTSLWRQATGPAGLATDSC